MTVTDRESKVEIDLLPGGSTELDLPCHVSAAWRNLSRHFVLVVSANTARIACTWQAAAVRWKLF